MDNVIARPAAVETIASPLSGWVEMAGSLCRAVQAFPFRVRSMDTALVQAVLILDKGIERCDLTCMERGIDREVRYWNKCVEL